MELSYQSLTLAIDTDKLPEAKKMMSDFQNKFCKKMNESNSKNAVYCLSTQLYSLEAYANEKD